jgi:hypothetical protein
MDQEDTGPNGTASDEQKKAMRELLKSLRAKAHFRYPIGEPSVIHVTRAAAIRRPRRLLLFIGPQNL